MKNSLRKVSLLLLAVLASCSSFRKISKGDVGHSLEDQSNRLKLVWLSLDGFQPDALAPWVSKLSHPHARGLKWLLSQAHGRNDLKVINPTITAPSHISTITCAGAGVHGILDNTVWTGSSRTSGFNQPYAPENWIAHLRKKGLRVGSSLYPSIDGLNAERTPDVGIMYDNPGSSPQIISLEKGSAKSVSVPDRADATKSFALEFTVSGEGSISVKTPWGDAGKLETARPVDFVFMSKIGGQDRKTVVSVLVVSQNEKITIEVSPVQMMSAFGSNFIKELDARNLFFSSLRDYRFQSNTVSYLSTLDHRRKMVAKADLLLLNRADLDAAFLYFEDLDALLHAYYKDDVNEVAVVSYLERFDQDLGQVLSAIPTSADLVVLGDHGMSAIAYVLNARKILTDAVASKGYVWTAGGALYLYPPQTGKLSDPPPADLDLNALAETLRGLELDLTGKKLFGKVVVRGSAEAAAEGLTGDQTPWIMAFANNGVGFKDSVENVTLLARAKWAVIPESLRSKYPDPMNNGNLVVPVPLGQHGHWNEISEMRTRLVLEGPRVGALKDSQIEKTLDLVPAVADALGWERPSSCAK